MNLSELLSEFQQRLSINELSGFMSSTTIKSWIDRGNKWACSYKPWPFMEGAKYTTATSDEYYDYPEEFLSDSISELKVEQDDGSMDRYNKVRFKSYQRYREDREDGEDKIFSDYGRYYFINPNTISPGDTIELWGQETPDDLTNDNDETPFKNDHKGEEAILKYAMAIGLRKKKNFQEAEMEEKKAEKLLDEIWSRIAISQAEYDTKDKPLFRRINILNGRTEDEINNENQF